jgi:hypothetical protein
MRESELQFISCVGKELTPLYEIAKKLDLDLEDAHSFMVYLEKQGEIRTSRMTMNDGNIIDLVALPLLKRSDILAQEANEISKEANKISNNSLMIAKWALGFSVISLIVAILTIILTR